MKDPIRYNNATITLKLKWHNLNTKLFKKHFSTERGGGGNRFCHKTIVMY